MKTTYAGINYAGHTNANRDAQAMIRYGVIPHHAVGSAWYDSSEGHYGEPHCPHCGNEAIEYHKASETIANIDEFASEKYECDDFACLSCRRLFGSESAFPDSPLSHYVDDSEISAEQGGYDSDIFISKSKFFTYAQFCSPCAPGACYLLSPLEVKIQAGIASTVNADGSETFCDDNRAYCFGHDWFEDGVAPYPVYSVETSELVQPDKR